ncbi:hypothetical protein J7K06_03620 [Candidatus Bathyarchaeota archaeon]|nr:hypothetical protein [Candidatus Bathyarchaeota archaeon]
MKEEENSKEIKFVGSNPTPCTTERTHCVSKIFAVIYNLKKGMGILKELYLK